MADGLDRLLAEGARCWRCGDWCGDEACEGGGWRQEPSACLPEAVGERDGLAGGCGGGGSLWGDFCSLAAGADSRVGGGGGSLHYISMMSQGWSWIHIP